MTATDTQPAAQAVEALTQAVELLNKVAVDMNTDAINGGGIKAACAIAGFAQVAVRNAEPALLLARNELKLAERDAR